MRTMLVFVDALGPAMLARLRRRLPWLVASSELRGELGYSSGAIATILTGRAPSEHGRMCLFSAHEAEGPGPLGALRWLGLLPRLVHERAALRRWAARAFAFWQGIDGYFALHRVPPEAFGWLDAPERDDLFTAPDVNGHPTLLARARRRGLSVLTARWQLAEAPRWRQALGRIEAEAPDLAFLYAAELDGVLHAHGSQGPAVEGALDRLAERVDEARRRMAAAGPVRTLLVGDHGMADVTGVIDPRDPLGPLAAQRFVDSTMVRFWGDEADLRAARRRLEGRWPGLWLDGAALGALDAPAAHGQAIFLLDEGWIFAPSFVGGVCRGMHGYDPASASARAALASDGPLPPCASLRDLAPLALATLGAP